MSSKLEPTLHGLPLEIRLAIWELAKPEGSFLHFESDSDEYCYVRGPLDEDGEDVGYLAALLLVNHQIYAEASPIYDGKTRMNFGKSGVDSESSGFPELSHSRRNLVTCFKTRIGKVRWTDEWVEKYKAYEEKRLAVYYHKVTVEITSEKRFWYTGGSVQFLSLSADVYVKDANHSTPPRRRDSWY